MEQHLKQFFETENYLHSFGFRLGQHDCPELERPNAVNIDRLIRQFLKFAQDQENKQKSLY